MIFKGWWYGYITRTLWACVYYTISFYFGGNNVAMGSWIV